MMMWRRLRLCGRLGLQDSRTAEIRQMHEVFVRHVLHGESSFSPSRKAAVDYKCIECFFPQQMRHPGAGRFAQSGAVQVDILVMGEALGLLLQVVRFDANRSLDARGAGVVVPMTANID